MLVASNRLCVTSPNKTLQPYGTDKLLGRRRLVLCGTRRPAARVPSCTGAAAERSRYAQLRSLCQSSLLLPIK